MLRILLKRLSRPEGPYEPECPFLIPKDKVVDDRKKVPETPIEGLYTPNLLQKGKRAALHETCPSMFCSTDDLRKSHSLSTIAATSRSLREAHPMPLSLDHFLNSFLSSVAISQRNAATYNVHNGLFGHSDKRAIVTLSRVFGEGEYVLR